MTTEILVTQHEESVRVAVVRCAGPSCYSVRHLRNHRTFQENIPEGFEFDTLDGWWHLEQQHESLAISSQLYFFCSWDCLKAAMLGMPKPVGA